MKTVAFALALALAVPALAAEPRVKTANGSLEGTTEASGIRAYRGIPFAQPPIDELRWQPPQPVVAWSQPLDATKFGAACPQPEDRFFNLTPPVQDEACLFLNVWAPKNAKALPVMVWIHGGSNRMGAGSLPIYDGTRLAQRGVVLVTLNYRVGYLGFFAHDALDAEKNGGNFGLQDQIAALKWVQANIAAFGGDPARVTVFGESAGAGSILALAGMPAARGLFARAIVQSAAPRGAFSPMNTFWPPTCWLFCWSAFICIAGRMSKSAPSVESTSEARWIGVRSSRIQ